MNIKLFQIDAFAEEQFSGNPAAVIPLDHWLEDDLMQQIAMENNLSETTFYVPAENGFEIRWFTPIIEVNLCGHATLACAHVLFNHYDYKEKTIRFHSKSGELLVSKEEDFYSMTLPTDILKQVSTPVEILKAFGIESMETYRGRDDYMIIVESQRIIESLNPDFKMLVTLENCRGVIITARGNKVDFVSRCFFPKAGIDEDHATGSALTTMTPYWAKILKKEEFSVIQLSKRKGVFKSKYLNEKCVISGKAITYSIGEIFIAKSKLKAIQQVNI
ncbi:MAG: PhzF family phenazine biosynthesis protein [Saprospiraceae bacterium]|jgi:PhzF family phenazine biosynthesis protein